MPRQPSKTFTDRELEIMKILWRLNEAPARQIQENLPGDRHYNRLITLPFERSHEKLWREDSVYDLIVVLGYNDSPVVPGKGSAIFLHVARPDFSPTEGCVACEKYDLLDMLEAVRPGAELAIVRPPSAG